MEKSTKSYRLVTSEDDLAALAKTLRSAEAIGLDLETTALSPRDGGVRLLQLATPEETFVIDAFEVGDLSALEEVLEDGPVKVGHNIKFDYQFLHAIYGVSPSPLFDTMLAVQVLDGGNYAASYSLEAVVERYLDESLDKTEQRSDWSGKLSRAQLEYAARDAAILLPLADRLDAALAAAGLATVAEIEMRALPALAWLATTCNSAGGRAECPASGRTSSKCRATRPTAPASGRQKGGCSSRPTIRRSSCGSRPRSPARRGC